MNPLLINGFGTSINVDKRKLIIINRNIRIHYEFYPHQINYDSIIIDGHTGNISFEAIRWLSKHDIPVTVLNWDGNLLATINPKEVKNGELRVKQYMKYLDSETRYNIAFTIVETKVRKSYELLCELSRFYEEVDLDKINRSFENEKRLYEEAIKKRDKEYAIRRLLLYEGQVALYYWETLTRIFNKLGPEFKYQSRCSQSNYHNMNACDEVNAMLNYGYAILESEVRKLINSVGLDLSVGYLHELHAAKTPLVFDLQELYRWLIDLSVIQLLEDKQLKKSDFIITENYYIRLKENTAKLLIDKIRFNFNSRATYKKKSHTYESIYLGNVQMLANLIADKTNQLKFDIPLKEIQRNDEVDLRNYLLNLTPTQRKELGISKTTLWYIKKNLNDGKKIKIYDKTLSKIT
jgi:CRISPR-associated protein Cas1